MIFQVLKYVENDSKCQKPKNPILIRFEYYLCRNDILVKIREKSGFRVLWHSESIEFYTSNTRIELKSDFSVFDI